MLLYCSSIVSGADPVGNVSRILSREGWSSEIMLRRGVEQAAHTLNNLQVECTGILLCVIREYLQLQLNCVGDKSRQRVPSLPLTLTDRPASFCRSVTVRDTQQTATGAQGSYCYMASTRT